MGLYVICDSGIYTHWLSEILIAFHISVYIHIIYYGGNTFNFCIQVLQLSGIWQEAYFSLN